jgi:hypothetical protein
MVALIVTSYLIVNKFYFWCTAGETTSCRRSSQFPEFDLGTNKTGNQ